MVGLLPVCVPSSSPSLDGAWQAAVAQFEVLAGVLPLRAQSGCGQPQTPAGALVLQRRVRQHRHRRIPAGASVSWSAHCALLSASQGASKQ